MGSNGTYNQLGNQLTRYEGNLVDSAPVNKEITLLEATMVSSTLNPTEITRESTGPRCQFGVKKKLGEKYFGSKK